MIYVSGPIAFDTILHCAHFPHPNSAVQVTGVHELFGGSAGNVAACLASLGESSSVISAVGEDFPGSPYEKKLLSLGVDTSHVSVVRGMRTSCAVMPVDSRGDLQSFFYRGATGAFETLPAPKLALEEGDIIHIATGEPSFNRRLAAAYPGADISFDPGYDSPLYSKEDLESILPRVKTASMNTRELETALHTLGKNAAIELLGYGTETLIITHGRLGSCVYSGGRHFEVKAYAKARIVDTTGAGDAYRAGFLAARAKGMPLDKCAKFGSATASFVIERVGSQEGFPSWEEARERASEL